MAISVKGALANVKPKQMTGWMTDDKGRPLSGEYVYEQFRKADFEGKKVLPMSDCDNFCYQDGCRGHDITLLVHDWEFEEGNG